MACFYLCIATAILGIIDVIIKLFDTIFQELKPKKVNSELNKTAFPKKNVHKEFSKEIKCGLGKELPEHKEEPTDPKEKKFVHDKELF